MRSINLLPFVIISSLAQRPACNRVGFFTRSPIPSSFLIQLSQPRPNRLTLLRHGAMCSALVDAANSAYSRVLRCCIDMAACARRWRSATVPCTVVGVQQKDATSCVRCVWRLEVQFRHRLHRSPRGESRVHAEYDRSVGATGVSGETRRSSFFLKVTSIKQNA